MPCGRSRPPAPTQNKKLALAARAERQLVKWASVAFSLEIKLQSELNDARQLLGAGGVAEARVVGLAASAIRATEVMDIKSIEKLRPELNRILSLAEGKVLVKPEIEV